MAGNTLCHSICHKVIEKFAEEIDSTVSSSPIVISSNIQKYFGPENTLYLKGNLVLIDFSILEIAIFASELRSNLIIDKYRLHYMDSNRRMLFRYDNASHHPEIISYPHHKHTPNEVMPASMPLLQDVLNEISAIIIEKSSKKS